MRKKGEKERERERVRVRVRVRETETERERERERAREREREREGGPAQADGPRAYGYEGFLVADWIHFTHFWDNITQYNTKSLHCWTVGGS